MWRSASPQSGPAAARARGRGVLALALASAGGCAHRRSAPAPAAWSYRIDASAPRWAIELCFEGAPPTSLTAGEGALAGLIGARDPASGRELAITEEPPRIDLTGLRGRCVAYDVDLEAAAGGWRSDVRIVGDDRLVATEAWLWHPPRIASDPSITVAFTLAEGESVSTPWPRLGERTYRLPTTALRWRSYAAVGRLERDTFTVAGGSLDVAILDGPRRLSEAGLRRWLTRAGEAVATLYGALPVSDIQVLVVPTVGWGDEPVVFGAVERGGGASILLLIGGDAEDDAFVGEWVAIHELLHLGMPSIVRGDAWLPEGFVTYYTEVVRARAGLRSEVAAWAALRAGFRRGRADVRGDLSLAEASAAMGRLHTYHWVYWGGAAIALIADVALREAGGPTLDDALRRLHTCCAASSRRWSAAEVMAQMTGQMTGQTTGPTTRQTTRQTVELDAGSHALAPSPSPSLSEIAGEILPRPGFPDLKPLYRKLGADVIDEKVALDDAAPLAHLRRAIFTGPHQTGVQYGR
ncbi:MAG: hypothetical protein H6711_22860 [Myxococcales bacterium]|nr:hypothetical protein [Myxococcales bacterium]